MEPFLLSSHDERNVTKKKKTVSGVPRIRHLMIDGGREWIINHVLVNPLVGWGAKVEVLRRVFCFVLALALV